MRRNRTILLVWSIITVCFLIIGGCGGGVQPVQVPDLHNAEVLNALVTLIGQQTSPSQHTDPGNPINLEGEATFSFEIQKTPNVAFTVGFLDQNIEPQETGEQLRYTLNLIGVPSGHHFISITAVNASSPRKTSRSPVIVQIWINLPVKIPILQMHEPNPDQGFHFPYFTYNNPRADKTRPVSILVIPNNSGRPSDDYDFHLEAARGFLNYRGRFFDELNVMSLSPVFPRYDFLYTQDLDHQTITTDIPELIRLDLQLINMIEDFRIQLEAMGFTVEEKILMEGYSASGHFSIRFVMLHPEIVKAVSAGGISWPILPIAEYEGNEVFFPLGISNLQELIGKPFDLEALQTVIGFVYRGAADDNFHRDPHILDLALEILGDNSIDIYQNVQTIYHQNGLSDFQVVVYMGEDMDHTKTFQEASADVLDFFHSILN